MVYLYGRLTLILVSKMFLSQLGKTWWKERILQFKLLMWCVAQYLFFQRPSEHFKDGDCYFFTVIEEEYWSSNQLPPCSTSPGFPARDFQFNDLAGHISCQIELEHYVWLSEHSLQIGRGKVCPPLVITHTSCLHRTCKPTFASS